eukprot:15320496-Alexandrium_andersonii.AAC.1
MYHAQAHAHQGAPVWRNAHRCSCVSRTNANPLQTLAPAAVYERFQRSVRASWKPGRRAAPPPAPRPGAG